MRIALAASSYLPRRGGVEEHVSHLARELRVRGHQVVVWTVDQGDAPVEPDDGIPVTSLPCPMPNRSLWAAVRWALAIPRAAWRWGRAYRAFRPDVIDIQCFGPNGAYATALARFTRTPLIYSNHGETFMDATNAFATSALLRRSLRHTLARAVRVTACSRFAAEDLTQYGLRTSPIIVGNAVDAEVPPAAIAPLPERYIVGVGRLVANKGFNELLDAFAYAGDSLDGVDLVIAGGGPEGDWLREYAAELGVADRTHFAGTLSRGQVVALLQGALIHTVPSRVEAFGIVVLEGWRAGVPVVATTHGGPPEFVHHDVDGVLCDPSDTEQFARILIDLVSDEAKRTRIGDAGRDRLSEFTWAKVADKYDTVFADALDSRRVPLEATS